MGPPLQRREVPAQTRFVLPGNVIPPPVLFGLLGLGTLAFGLILGRFCARIGDAEGSGPWLGRKTFHTAVFTGAVPAQLLLGFWGVVLYGTVIVLLVASAWRRGPRASLYRALSRGSEEGEDRGGGILAPLGATAAGGLTSLLLVGPFATVGYLVCGWGDPVGEVVGRRWGRHPYRIHPLRSLTGSRTLEGSMGVFGAGFLGGWAALALLGYPFLVSVGVGAFSALAGAVSEALGGRGSDNFWVQLLPSLAAWWILG